MLNKPRYRSLAILRSEVLFSLVFLMSGSALIVCGQTRAPQVSGRDVTILVTAMPRNDAQRSLASKLQPEDFVVNEEKRKQRIVSVKPASEAPRSSLL
jgi:hypothetical protein